MPSIQVPNSSSSQSPVRPREAKPRTGMVRGTHGKVPVQLAAQGQRTGPHEQRREGCRGAAGEGEMGAKVHVVDDGGTLAVTGWRIRGVAGETRTAIRLLEVKRARSRREHLLLGRVARQLRSTSAAPQHAREEGENGTKSRLLRRGRGRRVIYQGQSTYG